MRIDVFTIFPEVIAGYCATSILGRAADAGALDVRVHDLRDGADDARRSVDDSPFGGGAGMVLTPEPVFRSIESVPDLPRPLLLLAPGGRPFDQAVAVELAASAQAARWLLPAVRPLRGGRPAGGRPPGGRRALGRRLRPGRGELAALVVVEAVARLLPDVLGNEDSARDESFSDGLLEYPQYTRPADFRGWAVPEVLRSGDHAAVAAWRRSQSLLRTARLRPDLIERLVRASALSASDVQVLAQHGYDVPSGAEPE